MYPRTHIARPTAGSGSSTSYVLAGPAGLDVPGTGVPAIESRQWWCWWSDGTCARYRRGTNRQSKYSQSYCLPTYHYSYPSKYVPAPVLSLGLVLFSRWGRPGELFGLFVGGGHGFQGGPGVLILGLAAGSTAVPAMDGFSTDLMWPPRRLSTLERACRRRSTARLATERRYMALQRVQAARARAVLLPLSARPHF